MIKLNTHPLRKDTSHLCQSGAFILFHPSQVGATCRKRFCFHYSYMLLLPYIIFHNIQELKGLRNEQKQKGTNLTLFLESTVRNYAMNLCCIILFVHTATLSYVLLHSFLGKENKSWGSYSTISRSYIQEMVELKFEPKSACVKSPCSLHFTKLLHVYKQTHKHKLLLLINKLDPHTHQ